MRLSFIFKISVVLLLPLQAFPQSAIKPERIVLTDNKLRNSIDAIVHRSAGIYMQDTNTVGLSVGICFKKKNHTYNYGETRKGNGMLPTADHFYGIGSIGKTFEALLLAQAVTDGKARLEDDIRKYLPGPYHNLTYAGRPVLLVHLANHTSGLPNSIKTFPRHIQDSLRQLTLKDQVNFYASYTQDSIFSDLRHARLDTIPGTRFRYNNMDSKILTVVLERIYGQPYDKLITQFLRKEMNMTDTRAELQAGDISRIPTGYFRNEPQEFANLKGYYVGPALFSTINDMLKYIAANLSEEKAAIQLTHRRTWGKTDGYGMGLGWMMDLESDGTRYIYHDGNTRLGYNSFCIFYPEEGLGIVILVNDTINIRKLGDLANDIRKGLKEASAEN